MCITYLLMLNCSSTPVSGRHLSVVLYCPACQHCLPMLTRKGPRYDFRWRCVPHSFFVFFFFLSLSLYLSLFSPSVPFSVEERLSHGKTAGKPPYPSSSFSHVALWVTSRLASSIIHAAIQSASPRPLCTLASCSAQMETGYNAYAIQPREHQRCGDGTADTTQRERPGRIGVISRKTWTLQRPACSLLEEGSAGYRGQTQMEQDGLKLDTCQILHFQPFQGTPCTFENT